MTSPSLHDPWDPARSIPLDGYLERRRVRPLSAALLGLFLAFVLFQVVISPVATVLLLFLEGIGPDELLQQLDRLVEEQLHLLLTANSIGQLLGLAIPAFWLARLHSSRPSALLRLRRPDWRAVVLGVVGLFVLMPLVQWLGVVNESLPLPELLRELERSQMELIEQVLRSRQGFVFNVFMLAVIPALCEELLFRGYVQRQAERSLTVVGGILFSGIVFGLYHLRLTQILPLSVLGIYLAYVAWRTGSLWVPIVVHFANNAFAVLLGAYASTHPELGIADIEQIDVPGYTVFVGLVLFAGTILLFERWAGERLAPSGSSEPR